MYNLDNAGALRDVAHAPVKKVSLVVGDHVNAKNVVVSWSVTLFASLSVVAVAAGAAATDDGEQQRDVLLR